MSYQVLARKWRPKSFKTLVGQEHVVQALVNGLDQGRLHHAFLFTGTRGVGKTTIARILAKCLNCEQGVSSTPCGECSSCVDIDEGRFVDMMEIDAASRTGVDDMRELLENAQFMPNRGRFKVYIIDEVHMLSTQSFNALLKTLEEPPEHVKFVLATTDPQKIPVTVLSRCLQFNLRRLLPDQIGGQLEHILSTEGVEAEAAAIERLARAADGSMRDGLSLLDQAIAFGGGRLGDDDVASMLGSIEHQHIVELARCVAAGDAAGALAVVAELVALARDLGAVLADFAEFMHRVTLAHCAPDYEDLHRTDGADLDALAAEISPEDAQLYYQVAIQGRRDLNIAPDPRTGLEMTLMRMIAFRPAAGGAGQGAARPQAAQRGQGGPRAAQAREARRPRESTVRPTTPASKRATHEAPHGTAHEGIPGTARPTEHGTPGSAAIPAAKSAAKPTPPQPAPERATRDGGSGGAGAPERAGQQATPRPAPVSAPSPASPASTAASGVSGVREPWSETASRLDIAGPVRELARNITLDAVEGDRWRFLIPSHLAHLSSRKLLDRLGSALAEEIGRDVDIALVPADGKVETPAAAAERAQRDSRSDAERAIAEDPTVRALQEKLGAVVDPDSVQPIQ